MYQNIIGGGGQIIRGLTLFAGGGVLEPNPREKRVW
jgi:hypothetical protein